MCTGMSFSARSATSGAVVRRRSRTSSAVIISPAACRSRIQSLRLSLNGLRTSGVR